MFTFKTADLIITYIQPEDSQELASKTQEFIEQWVFKLMHILIF